MRSLACLLASLVLAAASAARCHAQTGAPPPAAGGGCIGYVASPWKEFTSEAGRFSVLLPGVPTEHVRPIETGALKGDAHLFVLQTSALYLVLYTDAPASTDHPAKLKVIFDTTRDTISKRYGARLLEEKEIALGEFPGRYVKMEAREGVVIRMKTYVVENRVYTLHLFRREAGGTSGVARIHEETAAKFFDSFKLIPARAGEAAPRE